MSSSIRPLPVPQAELATRWARRRDVAVAILAWIALVAVILWGAGHIIRTILILAIASLLAYALAPGVKVLQRFMPRFLAILIMYLIVLGAICALLYLITSTAIIQARELAGNVQRLLTPASSGQLSPLEQTARSFGITPAQISSFRTAITSRLESVAGSAIPYITRLFDTILNIILVAVLSIYLLINGSRIANWIRRNAPEPTRANFVLDTLQRIVGGYIRGQLTLSVLIGLLVGIGMFLLGVPYAVLLGVLAFVFSFIPIIGTFISGAICVLIALTHGWIIAVAVLAYFIGVHIFEGDVVGPRIVGKAVGIHPIVSLTALIAGSELFGIWGALFASPVAGVLQAIIIAIWTNWRLTHPQEFAQAKQQVENKVDAALSDHPNP